MKGKAGFQFKSLRRDNSLEKSRVIYDVEKNPVPTGREDDPIVISDSEDESENNDIIILSDTNDPPIPPVNVISNKHVSEVNERKITVRDPDKLLTKNIGSLKLTIKKKVPMNNLLKQLTTEPKV